MFNYRSGLHLDPMIIHNNFTDNKQETIKLVKTVEVSLPETQIRQGQSFANYMIP